MSADMTIRDCMHDADNLMTADEPAKNATQQFKLETVRSLILVDESGPVGLLTRSRMREIPEAELSRPARDFAAPAPVLHQGQTLAEARAELSSVDFDADRIPVVNDEGRFVGVIDREVVLREANTIMTGDGIIPSTSESSTPVTIQIGMDVIGTDSDKLGKVDQIVLEGDAIASFTVEHGLLGRHHKRIAADHVARADREAVYVDFGKAEFELLSNIEDREEETTPLATS